MKAPVALIEVQAAGEKPRLFRFTASPVTIGFHPRCDLALEPGAAPEAEVLLLADGPHAPLLRPTRHPGAFQVNGAPCTADTPVKPGDVITTDACRLTLRGLLGLDAAPKLTEAAEATSAATTAPVPASEDEPVTLSHAVPPEPAVAPDPAKAREVAGLSYLYLFFGPVQEHLLDDEVSEVLINGPRQIYIERQGRLEPAACRFASEQALQAAVINVARSVGRLFDRDNPRLDARLPDGSRVHAVMPPLARAGTTVAIRKFRRDRLTLDQLIAFGTISPEGARLLDLIVKLGRNLVVSGATSSGKTSVLNVLSALIPAHERILVLEDASELQLQQPHTVCFEARKADELGRGEVTLRDLLHSALRLRPDRLVVGEIRGGEALDLLQAMNTGHEGSMSTIHANSARDCLFRLETCALFSGIDIPLAALREQVASAVQVVIQTARLFDGTRKITGVTEVLGLEGGAYQLRDLLVYQQEGVTPDGRLRGRHVFTGQAPTFLPAARQRGLDVTGLLG